MKQPKTTLQKLDIPKNKRILVTSDIHGNLKYLEKVLEKAKFCDDDILIIVGDIVEKGTESLETLRYVKKLCEKGNTIALVGNVDAWRMYVIDNLDEKNAGELFDYTVAYREWKGTSFYEELAAECGYELNSAEDVLNAKKDIITHFKNEFDFLAELPTAIETQNFIFVHGGLIERKFDDNQNSSFYSMTKYDAFMDKTPHVFDKYVVVGHWPVSLYNSKKQQLSPIINKEKKIISIDGGCGIKKEGQLNLLVIPNIDCDIDDIYNVYYDELSEITALGYQEGSGDGIHICWIDRKVTVLEKGEKYTLIEHDRTKKRLKVPTDYIYDDVYCSDYSDRLLAVDQGNEMTLVYRASDGIIAKKNGEIGWYYGDFLENGEIKTKRLTVGKIKPEDKADVVKILRDDTVKQTYMLPDFEDDEAAEKLFLRLKELSEREDRFVFGVRLGETVIGFINDVEMKDGVVEMGYCFHPKYHGNGYCTEAFRAVIQFLFLNGFTEVKCGAFEGNEASLRVMQKCAMERLDYTDEIEYREKTHKCIYYSIKENKQ